MSKLDNTIVALGRTRQSDAVPVILEKLKLLGPKSSFSHYRSVALALEPRSPWPTCSDGRA